MKFGIFILLIALAFFTYKSLRLHDANDKKMFTQEEVQQEVFVGASKNVVLDKLGEPSTEDGDMWIYYKRLTKNGDLKPLSFSVFFKDQKVDYFLFEHR